MRSSDLTLRKLEVFVAVAKKGSMTDAANELKMSQPAVSMAISGLEETLNEVLFDRAGGRIRLNEKGKAFLPRILDLLAHLEDIQGDLGDGDGGLSGSLHVGASRTVSSYLMPPVLQGFAERNPDVRLVMEVGNAQNIIDRMERYEIDAGFVAGYCHSPDIAKIRWGTDQLCVVAAPDCHPGNGGSVTAETLEKQPWILREQGSNTREVFEHALEPCGVNLRVRMELALNEAVKRAAEAGLGWACLSRSAVHKEIAEGQLVEVPVPFLTLERHFYILVHQEVRLPRALKQFVRFAREHEAVPG